MKVSGHVTTSFLQVSLFIKRLPFCGTSTFFFFFFVHNFVNFVSLPSVELLLETNFWPFVVPNRIAFCVYLYKIKTLYRVSFKLQTFFRGK